MSAEQNHGTAEGTNAQIVPFDVEHAPGVAQLWNAHAAGCGDRWLERFEWQYVDNPYREGSDDFGWVLVNSDGRVVGSKLWMTRMFSVRGRDVPVRASTDTIVDPAYRLHSLSLIMRYFKTKSTPFTFSTSAGGKHAAIWLKRRGMPIPGSDRHLVAVLAPVRFFCARTRNPFAGLALGLGWHVRHGRCSLPVTARGVVVERVSPGDERLDEIWREARSNYQVVGCRDTVFRKWRFRPSKASLFLASSTRGVPLLWLAINGTGAVEGQRVAEVLDAFGDATNRSEASAAMSAVLRRLAAEGYSVAYFRGLADCWRGVLQMLGAQMRSSGTSYLFMGPDADSTESLAGVSWHITPADGDAGFSLSSV